MSKSVKIAIIVEGRTEKVFIPFLRKFLEVKLRNKMPNLDPLPYDGPIPKGDRLKSRVKNLLKGKSAADHVIALTDVHIDGQNPLFTDAADAKQKMKDWVGKEPRFHPHAAQYDFEAWLIPYWDTILTLAGSQKQRPASNPETVNHGHPPAYHLQELFKTGKLGKSYVKTRDAQRILRDNDLSEAIAQCSELKNFVNTILSLCGAQEI